MFKSVNCSGYMFLVLLHCLHLENLCIPLLYFCYNFVYFQTNVHCTNMYACTICALSVPLPFKIFNSVMYEELVSGNVSFAVYG